MWAKEKDPSDQSSLPFEIIPSGNINKLKVGDELMLKVVYQGKPLKGAKFSATDKKTASQQEGKWVQESESDANGTVRLKLISKGSWLLTAMHEMQYADQSECDKSSYRTTLTIGLK
jgi:nickel transport protein